MGVCYDLLIFVFKMWKYLDNIKNGDADVGVW